MSVELFLISIFAGYWFLRLLNFTRLSTLRAEGYHVLLKSILVGYVLIAIVSGLLVITGAISWSLDGIGLTSLMDRVVEGFLLSFSASAKEPRFYMVALLTIILAFVLPWLMNMWAATQPKERRLRGFFHFLYSDVRGSFGKVRNRLFCDEERAAFMDAQVRSDVTEEIFLRSLYDRKLVELALTGGESYTGFIVDRKAIAALRNADDVGLVPIIKRYKSSKARELDTVVYEAHVKSYLERGKGSKPKAGLKSEKEADGHEGEKIVIQMSSITSVRLVPLEEFFEEIEKS